MIRSLHSSGKHCFLRKIWRNEHWHRVRMANITWNPAVGGIQGLLRMGLQRDAGYKQGTSRTKFAYKAWEEANQVDSKAFRT